MTQKDLQNQPTDRPGAAVLALCADLIFTARIRGAAQAAGVGAQIARNADDLVGQAAQPGVRLVFVDLDARGDPVDAVRRLKESPAVTARVFCFVSHVREDAIALARAAGADRVMARSAFVRELPALLQSLEPYPESKL